MIVGYHQKAGILTGVYRKYNTSKILVNLLTETLFIYIIKHVYFIRYKNKQKGKMVIFLSQHSQSEG